MLISLRIHTVWSVFAVLSCLDSFLTRIAKTEHIDPNLAWARKPFGVFCSAQALTRTLERGEESKEY